MANGSIVQNLGRNIMLYRTFTANGSLSSTQYLPPTKFRLGINADTPSVTDTALDVEIPIQNGTVNDNGSNLMTGSSGGDNTTDNSTTYKQGAGQSDNQSQNLIANGTSASKIWTISALTANVTTTNRFGFWLYIKDATALAKFKSSGTCVEARLGSDTSNYYYKQFSVSSLSTGWNWLTSGTTAVSGLSTTGSPAGSIDTFVLIITTNNSTDTFVAGDVLYDLLRTFAVTDLNQGFQAGYPTFDYVANVVEYRCYITTVLANGFNIDAVGVYNEDTTPLLYAQDKITSESKSESDEFLFIARDRLL